MFDIYYTAIILFLLTVSLLIEFTRPVYILFAALLLLILGGILPIAEAFSGFSNQGMLTIAVLYIIARTLQGNTTLKKFIGYLLRPKRKSLLYPRFMLPIAFLSAFLNNTPLVASLMPHFKNRSHKNLPGSSHLLIPLSYAAILGGMCTLIGTSTNLVVHGMLLDQGYTGFGFFELGKIGLPIVIISTLYFALLGYKFLPERKDPLLQLAEESREFVAEVKVLKECPLIGKTIRESNLRQLRGLYLFQIIRNDEEITPLAPEEVLYASDRLFFTGLPETIYDILKTPGFQLIKGQDFDLQHIDSDKHQTYEAVISNSSPLIGESVRESNFRAKYNAVILAIHRNGQRINRKIGDIVFQRNDTLFILADKIYEKKWYNSTDFSLISESVSEYSKPRRKNKIAFLLIALMVVCVSTGLIPSMLLAASITAGLLLALRIVSYQNAKNAVDLDILLIIVAALGIGKAVTLSGLAAYGTEQLLVFITKFGPIGVIASIFLLTNLYTELITNSAAAAIGFPFVLAIASQLNLPLQPLMIVLAIAASTSFASPLGYQTNLMVYNAGGYRFKDFLRAGIPINILVGIVTTMSVYFLYFR